LNVSGCNNLECLYCNENLLTNLDVSECRFLDHVDFDKNQLKLSILYDFLENIFFPNMYYNFGIQKLLTQTVVAGEEIDFSTEEVFGGVETVFVVEKNGENAVIDVDYTIANGILTFLVTGNYTITMTNEAIESHPNGGYLARVIAEFECNSVGIFSIEKEQTLTCYVQNGILYVGGFFAGEKWRVYTTSGLLIKEDIRQKAESEEVSVTLH
jgi:hypothetical protein